MSKTSKKNENIIATNNDDNSQKLTESSQILTIPGMYEDIIDGAFLPLDYCEKIDWK